MGDGRLREVVAHGSLTVIQNKKIVIFRSSEV